MAIRVGINGFGRIGRQVYKAVYDGGFSDLFEIVAVNDLAPNESLAHLLKYDSTYGRFDADICATEGRHHASMARSCRSSKRRSRRDPVGRCRRRSRHRVDWPLHRRREGAGSHRRRRQEGHHLRAGARARTSRSYWASTKTSTILSKHDIISNASCTTNCLAPVAKVVLDNFGIKRGIMTTVHSYTNDQVILDGPHKDPAPGPRRRDQHHPDHQPARPGRLRSSSRSSRASSTASRCACRPRPSRSSTSSPKPRSRPRSKRQRGLQGGRRGRRDARHPRLHRGAARLVGLPGRSALLDHRRLSTMVIGETMVKVIAWYDNEWGYSCRVADLTALICEAGIPGTA